MFLGYLLCIGREAFLGLYARLGFKLGGSLWLQFSRRRLPLRLIGWALGLWLELWLGL